VKESSNGRAHHWKVELVGLPASIRLRFQFAEQPPRATVIAGASHASFVCIEFFQADYC